jgi:CRP/FNR family transcriptional regulator
MHAAKQCKCKDAEKHTKWQLFLASASHQAVKCLHRASIASAFMRAPSIAYLHSRHRDVSALLHLRHGPALPSVGMSQQDLAKMDTLVQERVRVHKGETLYRMGEPLTAVYAIRFGTLKTHVTMEDGRTQITGFHLPGEVVGLDGLGEMQHASDATALEDTEVCVVRFDDLQSLSGTLPSPAAVPATDEQGNLAGPDHADHSWLDACRRAPGSISVNMSERLSMRGYSSSEFVLRMSREEIGSYLGLKLETVSRLFSRFAEAGLIQIRQRHVKLVDMEGIRQVYSRNC